MAYVTEEIIKAARAGIKQLNKQYGVKATVSGLHTSTLKLTISEGCIDFISSYIETPQSQPQYQGLRFKQVRSNAYLKVNHYYLSENFSQKALEYLEKANAVLHVNHYWDKSDSQSDYFNCSFYVNIHIGRWNKPYVYHPAS